MLRERIVTILAALCYVPFASVMFCLVTLLRYPHSGFALYHVKQGFALFIVWFLSLIFISLFLIPGLIFWALLLFYTVRVGYGAFSGKQKIFPGLKTFSHLIPAEKMYSHLTGTDFPQHS